MPCLRNESGGGERRGSGADKVADRLKVKGGENHQTFFAMGLEHNTEDAANYAGGDPDRLSMCCRHFTGVAK
jgi:hypothetical protein